MPGHIIIDFDSTFTRVEALDVLAEMVLHDHPDKQIIAGEMHSLTVMAMEGKLPFDQALKQRLNLFTIRARHLNDLTGRLKKQVSASFARNRSFLAANAQRIIILSGGFREFIVPVVHDFGIPADHVYANTFSLDHDGVVTGFDEANPLAQAGGKVKLIKSLNLPGKIIVIGDGYTDYEIRQSGLAETFYLFTENIERASLISKADHVVGSLDEIIATFQ